MAMKRSTSALASLALHGVLGALLLQLNYQTGAPSAANVMYATLVRFDDRPAVDSATEPTPHADEPPPLPASPPATSDPPTPPAEPAESTPPPTVEPPLRAATPPPAEPPAAEPAVVDAPEPEPEPAPEPLAAEPPRPVLVESIEPDETPPITAPAPRPVEPAANETPTVAAEATPVEHVSMPAPQQEMLAERFADWTNRSSAAAEPTVWKHDGREYTAVFRPLPAEDSTGLDRLIVEVSTEHGGQRVATQLRMKRLAFSSFAQFVDRWDPEVQIHDDEIDGRFHSNTEINVLRNREARPIFRGRVTTASRSIRTDSLGRLDRRGTFLAGLETGVRKIFMPQRFAPFENGAAPREHVREFTQDTRIVFRADGTYTFEPLDAPGGENIVALGDAPQYLIATDDAALHVRGVVKGRVLVYSPNGIVIEGNLTYSEPPPADPAVGDYLGLVSDRSIAVAGPEVTGAGDLSIHASIFAKRQFAVRNFRSRSSGTLYVYGSVSAGSITATEPRYATKIEFDDRLEHLRAPGFPLTNRYELESWDALWQPVERSGGEAADARK